MAEYQDAFISYGRADSKFLARKLYNRLNEEGLKVWFDFADIPLGVDYQKQIDDGIETTHNFLFIIAPHSVHSSYCRLEIELALRCNKRIIPLLHVEEINQETWQERNPRGTQADWEAFVAAGKHSSFQGMHPAISKINWIYFREGIDDFEQSVQGLLSVFARQEDYVYRHTVYLKSALQWDRHQQRSEYLLAGESLQEALVWLKTRFNQEQPPCIPTDLHCRFITQSELADRNDRSDIYLCYADEDQTIAIELYWKLLREGWLVWNRKMDLESSGSIQEKIFSAIENSDIFIYILSSNGVRSKGCQKEISHASNLGKRIISLQVRPIETERRVVNKVSFKGTVGSSSALNRIYDRLESKSPDGAGDLVQQKLRGANPIKLVDYETQIFDPEALKQLFQELQRDASFYQQQTELLIRALQWKGHRYNPNLLLQGYRLAQAQSWLKLAKEVQKGFFTTLQQDYIQVSSSTTPPDTIEVFFLYSAVDKGFTQRIHQALQIQGRVTGFIHDQFDPEDPDYFPQCQQMMLEATNCVAIVSSSLLKDPMAQRLLIEAVTIRKRLLPILYRPIDPSLFNTLRTEVAEEFKPILALFQQGTTLEWIDFAHHNRDFYIAVGDLIRALDHDRDYVQAHSKWGLRARQWNQENQREDLLLRGHDLESAHLWLHDATQERRSPPVTEIQRQFIEASQKAHDQRIYLKEQKRQEELRRARQVAIASASAGLLMAGMALFTTLQLRNAEIETITTLRISAEVLFSEGNELDGLVQIVTAAQRLRHSILNTFWPYKDTATMVEGTLREILLNINECNETSAQAVQLSASGRILVIHQDDGTLQIWYPHGTEKAEWKTDRREVGLLAISPDDRYIVTGGSSGQISLWSTATPDKGGKHPLKTWSAHSGAITALSFMPDGISLLSTGTGKAYRWDLRGTARAVFPMSGQTVVQTVSSPTGDRILTLSQNQQVELWTPNGYSLGVLKTAAPVQSFAFSPHGQYLLLGLTSGQLELWDRTQGQLLQRRQVSSAGISAIAFAPDWESSPGDRSRPAVITGSDDGVIRLWDSQAHLQREIFAHTGSIQFLQFQQNTRGKLQGLISLGSQDGTLAFWSLEGWQKFKFAISRVGIKSLQITPDANFFALLTQGGQARMWSLEGHQHYTLRTAGDQVSTLRYSPNGQFLATLSSSGILELWQLDWAEGGPQKLRQWLSAEEVQFSPDSRQLLWLSNDPRVGQVVQIRSLNPLRLDQGRSLTTPESQNHTLSTLQISPNGQRIAVQSQTGRAYIWDLTGEKLINLRPHAQPLKTLTFHPTLNTFLTTDSTGEMRYWQGDGTQLWSRELRVNEGDPEIYLTQFSPDGRSLLTLQWAGNLQVWDVQTGTLNPAFSNTLNPTIINGKVFAITFNPGTNPAIGGLSPILLGQRSDSSLFFQSWSPDWKQTHVVSFNVHEDGVKEAAFIPVPGATWAQTISWGGVGRLWDIHGHPLAKIQNHYGQVQAMAISPDRHWLVTAGRDGTAKFWPLQSTDELLHQSCQWLKNHLNTYDGDDPHSGLCTYPPEPLKPPSATPSPRQKNP